MLCNLRFLLINGGRSSHWHQALTSALAPIGLVEGVAEANAVERIAGTIYHLAIIDATEVVNVANLVKQIRRLARELPILVAAASPDWVQAREALQAGATDYITKTHDLEDLREAVQTTLLGVRRD